MSKNFIIFLILLIAVIGCVPQQQTKTPSTGKINTTQTKQTNAKDDFGCFSSCDSLPEGYARQMCGNWKSGKAIQWPDCSILSDYPNCVKLCELEKKETASTQSAQTQQQATGKDDFGCWPPSCSYIPDPRGKQLCEDWKAGKKVQWPDCSIYSSIQPACQKLCEFEKKGVALGSEQTGNEPKQAFNELPSLVKAEFASGVTDEDRLFVIHGISAMDFYLKKWFGKSTNQPSGLRVSATQATGDLSTGAQIVVENGITVIEVKTKSEIWNMQTESKKQIGGEPHNGVSMHEYVHVYQFQNGCGSIAQERLSAPKWFYEGEAVLLSYKVMPEAGWSFPFSIQQMIPLAKQETGLLKSFETNEGTSHANLQFAYPLFATAVDYLIKDKPITALDDFCANMGKGQDVPTAFQSAFGIALEKFYEEFEAYRKTW